MENPKNTSLKDLDELIGENEPGYPKSIYDDSQITLQHWKRNGFNELFLIIPKILFTEKETRLYWDCPDGQPSIYLNLPKNINSGIVAALRVYRGEVEREIVVLEKCLAVALEDEVAQGIGELLHQTGVDFNSDLYEQFQKARSKDMETLDEAYYKSIPWRPIHPNIFVLKQELKAIESQIDAADPDSDDYDERQKAVEFLTDSQGYLFEMCQCLLEEIPNLGGSKEEDEARNEIERRIGELQKKKQSKLADFE